MTNILEFLTADKNMSTMLRAVRSAGMDTDFEKEGAFTLFAPGELAFNKLGNKAIAELLRPENTFKLAGIIKDHLVLGKKRISDLRDGQILKTVSGKELKVTINQFGRVMINGATVQSRDGTASNGFVHSIEMLLQVPAL